ncbi:cyclic nucleotide-binding domain-containing protein [bacterium]|nr:cyclic nucleotide-binding domain-containing protein [bacterium]
MESLEKILAEHPFMDGLDRIHLQLITGCASNARFEADEFIFKEGQEANQFYIIRHGQVALQIFDPNRGPLTIQTIGEGEILGWSWLIPPYHWHFDAHAVSLTRAIALDGKCLRTKCEDDHDLGFELLKRFAHIMEQRLKATQLQLLDLYNGSEK